LIARKGLYYAMWRQQVGEGRLPAATANGQRVLGSPQVAHT